MENTTKSLHTILDQYSTERQALHQQIIQELTAGYTAATDQPLAIYLGGGTASGKSSLSKMLVQSFRDENEQVIVIDSDHIKQRLPEYQEWLKRDPEQAASFTHDESSEIADMLYERCTGQRLNVIYDGTMKNTVKYSKLIDMAKDRGYAVSAVLADVPLEEAFRRAEIRFQIEKRRVPETIIRQSHEQVPMTFHQLKDKLDSFYLYDTSQRYPVQFYVKQDNQIQVRNEERLNHFYKKAGMSYDEWTQLPAATLLKDVLKLAQGMPTGGHVTPELLTQQISGYRLDRTGGKETMHYKRADGQLGNIQLEKVPFLSIKDRNMMLDQAAGHTMQSMSRNMDFTQ